VSGRCKCCEGDVLSPEAIPYSIGDCFVVTPFLLAMTENYKTKTSRPQWDGRKEFPWYHPDSSFQIE
jgi:hypothetical protein